MRTLVISLAALSIAGSASAQDSGVLSDFAPVRPQMAPASLPVAAPPPGRIKPSAPRALAANETWKCFVVSATNQTSCTVLVDGLETVGATWYAYTKEGVPLGRVTAGAAASPRATQARMGSGLQHTPDRELIVRPTGDGGTYMASYEKDRTGETLLALGAASIIQAGAGRLFFGKDGGYYSGYNRYGAPVYRGRCSMPPGYTGPIVPC